MTGGTRPELQEKLEWACQFYADWYDGKRYHDCSPSSVAYELASAIRGALMLVRADAPPEEGRDDDGRGLAWTPVVGDSVDTAPEVTAQVVTPTVRAALEQLVPRITLYLSCAGQSTFSEREAKALLTDCLAVLRQEAE